MNWSLIYTFFPSLSLAHLERSLYSLSRQTIWPDDMLIYDNNSPFSEAEIKAVIKKYFNLVQLRLVFDKHGDRFKTASYCHNKAIPMAAYDTFILARADLIFDFDYCRRVLELQGGDPMVFTSSWMYQMPFLSKASYEKIDHAADLEPLNWRQNPQRLLKNSDGAQMHTAAELDSASFCLSKHAFNLAGGYDEYLNTWGLWQQSFHTELRSRGVKFKIIPEPLIFHMLHQLAPGEGERDQAQAVEQWRRSPRRKMKEFQQL